MDPDQVDDLLSPIYAALDQQYPPPDRIDQQPQLLPISTNVCPNYRPRRLSDLSTCDVWAFTTWGYCAECWQNDMVPASWRKHLEGVL